MKTPMGVGRSVSHTRQHHLAARHISSITIVIQPIAELRPGPAFLCHPRTAADRDRDLERADLTPQGQTGPPGSFDAHRIRDRHEQRLGTRGLSRSVTSSYIRPLVYLAPLIAMIGLRQEVISPLGVANRAKAP